MIDESKTAQSGLIENRYQTNEHKAIAAQLAVIDILTEVLGDEAVLVMNGGFMKPEVAEKITNSSTLSEKLKYFLSHVYANEITTEVAEMLAGAIVTAYNEYAPSDGGKEKIKQILVDLREEVKNRYSSMVDTDHDGQVSAQEAKDRVMQILAEKFPDAVYYMKKRKKQ
jgi:hypothetical protein